VCVLNVCQKYRTHLSIVYSGRKYRKTSRTPWGHSTSRCVHCLSLSASLAVSVKRCVVDVYRKNVARSFLSSLGLFLNIWCTCTYIPLCVSHVIDVPSFITKQSFLCADGSSLQAQFIQRWLPEQRLCWVVRFSEWASSANFVMIFRSTPFHHYQIPYLFAILETFK